MVKKIIIIAMILLLIPVTLADFITLEKEPSTKTKDNTLNISGETNVNNKITVYIDNSQKSFKLKDGTTRNEITSDGKIDLCIDLHQGVNNVRIESKGEYLLATKEFSIELDTTIPNIDSSIFPDFVNEEKKKITLLITEPSTIYVEVKDVESSIKVEPGNPEITIPIKGEFKEGNNQVKIRIVDEAGNEQVIEKNIILDTKKPEVTIDSIDDKPYTNNMKADFAVIKIKGNTEPNINLKVINLFDNISYFYDETQNKFMKNNKEITSKSENAVEVKEDGTFETYVDLLPGKNAIVFLATDKALNQNTFASSDNNINPTLMINYESSQTWDISVSVAPEKIKAANMVQSEVPVRVEIKLSPKNVDPKKMTKVTLSIQQPDEYVADNKYLGSVGQPSVAYYNEEKKKYITYQNLVVKTFPGNPEDIPENIHSSLKGNIQFSVAGAGKEYTFMESIPIDLLLYVESTEWNLLTPLLIPINMDTTSSAIDKSLAHMRGAIKNIQIAGMVDGGLCIIMKIYNNLLSKWHGGASETEKRLEYAICDRVYCYDTPPKSPLSTPSILPNSPIDYTPNEDSNAAIASVTATGSAILTTQYYQYGYPTYHETACIENIWRSITPHAPVRVYDDLYESTRCLCLPGMWMHLKNLYADLSAIQSCIENAKIGREDPGHCEILAAQGSCALTFWAIQKIKFDESKFSELYQRSYHVRTSSTLDILNFKDLKDLKDLAKQAVAWELERTKFEVLKQKLLLPICANILTQDWQHIGMEAIKTGFEAVPSFGAPVAASAIKEENKKLVIEYAITPVIYAGTHPVSWRINFACDESKENGYLCEGFNRGYASDLERKYFLEGTVSPGTALQATNIIKDEEVGFWFNKIELQLRYYITDIQQEVIETIDSDISQQDVNKLSETLCKNKDYKKKYRICDKISTAEPIEKTPGNFEYEGEEGTGGIA